MTPIRVLVIEDSLTVRKRLVEVLEEDPAITVVGEAADGASGLAICERLRPDVVTLDIVLPDMSGVTVTEQIMGRFPTPILIVSAAENRGEMYDTYDAMAAGAVDLLEKPTGHDTASWERQLLQSVKLVSRIKVIRHIRARGSGPLRSREAAPAPSPPPQPVAARPGQYELVVIGASTGGPAAIEAILKALPPSFPLPILFVLHIAEPFASSFLGWLSSHTGMPVRQAADGEPLPGPGRPQVIMAPADRHLVVRGGRLRLTDDRERHSCRPSVDVLFESVALEIGEKAIACLLTGMGRDGAKGLLAIQRAGGLTLAQDQETSVVYGMPGEAAMLGAASRILPLGRIAETLSALAEPKR